MQTHSQPVTSKPAPKDSVVILKKSVAEKVLKELNNYDALKVDYSLLSQADSTLLAASNLKDSIIKVYRGESVLYRKLVDTLGYQISLKDQQTTLLHQEISKGKRTILLTKAISFAVVLITILFFHPK